MRIIKLMLKELKNDIVAVTKEHLGVVLKGLGWLAWVSGWFGAGLFLEAQGMQGEYALLLGLILSTSVAVIGMWLARAYLRAKATIRQENENMLAAIRYSESKE